MIQSISIIGAGNVATHFAKAFYKAGISIDTILSQHLSTAKELATQVKAKATTSFNRLSKKSDLYIIAVPDDAIKKVSELLKAVLNKSAYIVHTSGATSISSIHSYFENTGVIWPPQSLSKQKAINFSEVPICYGSSDPIMTNSLLELIKQVSHHHQYVDDKQKLALHLAAVFANNFSNHMYHIAFELCQKHKLDFSLLYPIIVETAQKVIGENPGHMQTGPAIREDLLTLEKHKSLINDHKAYKKLYSTISKSIQDHKLNS